MTTKLLIIAGLVLAMFVPLARAQEDWGDRRGEWGERQGHYMRELRMDCEDGDERACERLRHMRREWREDHRWRNDERGGAVVAPPLADPKVALCLAISNNYNTCMKQQHGKGNACAAWVYELKANHCF